MSFQEAQAHECWRQAMPDELTAIEANGTWNWEEAPVGIRAISLKWVFKTKRDTVGNISKYKARLVAKGFHTGSTARVCATPAGLRGRLGVAGPSHGCEIDIPQRRAARSGLHCAALDHKVGLRTLLQC
jgi:hypothetical protein